MSMSPGLVFKRSMQNTAVILTLLSLAGSVTANYPCVCNGNVYSVRVYQEMSKASTVIGHIDHTQCKQRVCSSDGSSWTMVEFETQFGYIDSGSLVETKTCSGLSPATYTGSCDLLNATTAPTSRPLSSTAYTEARRTTATKATPTDASQTTPAPTTTNFNVSHATSETHTTPTKAINTGVGDNDGDQNLCPKYIRDASGLLHVTLGHFGHKCYTLDMGHKLDWHAAEQGCAGYHGHLVHIENAAEQAFVHGFLSRHAHGSFVWIGLHDRFVESIYMWSNGGLLTYSNWLHNHYNGMLHDSEDCVVMRPDGFWDDINCGQWIFSYKETHLPVLCQFDSLSYQTLIG